MEEILLLSASRLAELIKRRELTSSEAVSAHIARIKKVNKTLNAVVKPRFEEARKEAKLADEAVKSRAPEELPPFHGVPCTIKECFALTGMPNTSGLVARKGFVCESDATAVSRLRNAGAIPLGVTNVSELCMWMETSNRVYGRTNNPYDPRRIVGGSSGGEGAIVGAGGSPFGLGSDIGGSIRMPAFFNGIFGHKPTGGLVPGTGQYPMAENKAQRYLTTGVLCRRAEDLFPLLKILAGPDGKDSGCEAMTLGDVSKVKISELKVLNVTDNGAVKVSEELQEAQNRCAAKLAEMGAVVKTISIKALKDSLAIWSAMLADAGGRTFSELLGDGEEINVGAELAKWAVHKSPYTLPAIGLAGLEKLQEIAPKRKQKLVEKGLELKAELVDLIGGNRVMLYPSYPTVAPLHYEPLLPPFNWVYTAIINVMELPSTQVPLGLNKEGLPLGVQVVSVHKNDHLSIAVAMELEKAFGGWVPPESLGA